MAIDIESIGDSHTADDLQQMQSLPLNAKVEMTKRRITEWVEEFGIDKVYVSFSGGKDSTVLLHIARELYPDIQAVFCDTGLNFPEIRDFVKTFDNVVWLKPEKDFRTIITEYGYPIVSKEVSQAIYDARTSAKNSNIDVRETKMYKNNFDRDGEKCVKFPKFCKAKYEFLFDAPFDITSICCDIMKERPSIKYERETGRKPIIGTMASESNLRRTAWLKYGCNAFSATRQISKPISFWTNTDILSYIYRNNIDYARSVYGDIVFIAPDGCKYKDCLNPELCNVATENIERTGCMFCGFGCATQEWSNMKYIKQKYPKVYEYIMKPTSDGGLGFREVFEWINENSDIHIDY